MASILVCKPYYVGNQDLPFITLREAKYTYFVERDENGLPVSVVGKPLSPEERVRLKFKKLGADQGQIEQIVQAWYHSHCGQDKDKWISWVDIIMGWEPGTGGEKHANA